MIEIFDKNSADKIWSKKDKGWKVPFLMPIRVKAGKYNGAGREPSMIFFSNLSIFEVEKCLYLFLEA